MNTEQQIEKVENRIINLRGQQVIIDRDVAELYGVETRDVNKAVKNNPDKFPNGYIFPLTSEEKLELVENFHRFNPLKHSTALPHAFTEKGLYMLATILKSPIATMTTFAIIETFSKLRLISRTIQAANEGGTINEDVKKKLQDLMNEVMNHDPLPMRIQKMTFSLNLGVIKISVETKK